MRGLYIHIPFCLSKCGYCDFNSYANEEKYYTPYVDALLKEAENFRNEEVDTVYIGGGTPTALPQEELCRLLTEIRQIFVMSEGAEFTVEMNPATAGADYLKNLQRLGVNRISMGAQSFDDGILKFLGRIHGAEDIKKSVELCKNAGIDNISMDLMFSLPTQTFDNWKNSLEMAVLCKPSHISCYALKIEEGTPFHQKGYSPLPDEDDRKMYHYAIDFLKEQGYNQYEISNFSLPGKESRHNLKYWHCEEYFGLGAGAHGYINGVRKSNVLPISQYIEKINSAGSATKEAFPLNSEDIKEEKIIMGLRLLEGIPCHYIKDASFYIQNGFMKKNGENICFTTKGFDVSNEILSRLI